MMAQYSILQKLKGIEALHAQIVGKRRSVGEQSLSHEQREGQRHQKWVPVEELASVIGGRIDLQW